MQTHKIANKDASAFVARRQVFQGSNLYSANVGNSYVVYSYGPHFPLFIYQGGVWYQNDTKYSPTTGRHHSQARPHGGAIEQCSTDRMKELLRLALQPAAPASPAAGTAASA